LTVGFGFGWVEKMRFFFAITFYLLTWEHSLCLNRADLLDISKQPHDRANLIEELKLFTKGREYAVFISRGESKDILKKSPTFIAKEKIVRGRFLVSEAKYPKSTKLTTVIVTFDESEKVYKKWTITPGYEIINSVGIGDTESRTISWFTTIGIGERKRNLIGLECYNDKMSNWKEITFNGRKIDKLVQGKAIKVR